MIHVSYMFRNCQKLLEMKICILSKLHFFKIVRNENCLKNEKAFEDIRMLSVCLTYVLECTVTRMNSVVCYSRSF